MTTPAEYRASLADAAALILADAVANIDEPGTKSRMLEVLSPMIERGAELGEYTSLLVAVHNVAVMAIEAELRNSIDKAGPAVDLLVRMREKVRGD